MNSSNEIVKKIIIPATLNSTIFIFSFFSALTFLKTLLKKYQTRNLPNKRKKNPRILPSFRETLKMTKLIVLSLLVATAVMSEGLSFKKLLNRRDPFPEPENPPPPGTSNIVWGNITQDLDHFDLTNDASWEQRYLMNGEFFREGGAIFVFLAGEWEITPYRLENSLMANLARELNGYMFYLEHRYYGQSRPTE